MTMTLDEALSLPITTDDEHSGTIRDYLFSLLSTLWDEQEGFSGKRPFGDSGWEYDLYVPLIKAGIVSGELDADGYYITGVDKGAARDYVHDLIYHVFYGKLQ